MVEDRQGIKELTDILDKDIETIVALRMHAERKVSRHQRLIENMTNSIGRPQFLYLIILFVIIWLVDNVIGPRLGLIAFDPAPFYWLQGIIGVSALLVTTMVLITQNRQNKFTEQRRHLDLQITLLTERKVSKVIELLEELRQDMPNVKKHQDPEAVAMQEAIDPHTALTTLNETLQAAAKEVELEIEQ